MALVLADRVQETSTSPGGTGTLNLSGTALAGFKTFSSGIGTGNSTYYCIFDTTAYTWEVGIGTYTSGTPGTLSRTTILSNSSGTTSAINFTNGNTLNIFCTYPSEKSVNLDSSGNVSALGTISSGTWQGTTVGVAYGGTGVTASSGANSVVLRDANQNIAVNSVTQNLTKTTSAAGTTTLTLASSHFQVLTGTTTQTYKLPDATSLPVGTIYIFDNDSTGNLTVQDNALGTVDVVAPGGYSTVFLEANGTVAGEWGRFGMIPNEVNWGTNSLALGGSTIVSGGTWQGNPIAYNYGGTGLTTFTAANYALYSTSASALTAGTLPVAAGGTGLTSLTAGYIPFGAGTSAFGSSANLTFDGTTLTATGNAIISDNSTNAALRITQLGTGNALLVEDSSNPDSTPFVVNADGVAVLGSTTPVSGITGSQIQIIGDGVANNPNILRYSDAASASSFILNKSRGSKASPTIVQSSDPLGSYVFSGYDGTAFIQGASIQAQVDGTPGTNDMPGRLVFSTTADGASSPTERMRIDNAGQVGIGGTPTTGATLSVTKNIAGATAGYGVLSNGQIQSTVTSGGNMFMSFPTTQATSFTLTNLRHFYANQSTIGAGSAVTNQYGFHAESTLTGATNNYGFFSNIASGTGRYNFYAAGDADNYMAGRLGIGSSALTSSTFRVSSTISGATTSYAGFFSGTIQPTVTAAASYNATSASTAANGGTPWTLTALRHYQATQGTFNADSTVTSQYGFLADSTLTGATNNYGFYSNIASGTGRYNFYAAGTADNYFAGNVGIGTTSPSTKLQVNDTITIGTADKAIQWLNSGTALADIRADSSSNLIFRNTSSYTERMRITANGGVSFGSSGTAYGSSGQVLTSSGDAPPTWTTPVTVGKVIAMNLVFG